MPAHRHLLLAAACAALSAFSAPAIACGPVVKVAYQEASPDRIDVELVKDADGQLVELAFDMSPSVGRAYVDTYYGPVPDQATDGPQLIATSGFGEGDRVGVLTFRAFRPGQRYGFHVDFDEAIGSGNDEWLEGGEIGGTVVSARITRPDGSQASITGSFDRDGVALVGNRACS